VLGEIIEGALTRRLVSLALINRLAKSAPSLSLSLSLLRLVKVDAQFGGACPLQARSLRRISIGERDDDDDYCRQAKGTYRCIDRRIIPMRRSEKQIRAVEDRRWR